VNALELSHIGKRFGPVTALEDVSLAVAPGEVLALVGENGAGKSTLVSIASGLYAADSGSVQAFGQELRRGEPRAAIDAGIGVVHQHFMLAGPLTAWENVVLGREPRRLGFIDQARARGEVAEIARRFSLPLEIDAPAERLPVAAQQRLEIVKQLWRGARVLILDEPTALLAPQEAAELIRSVRALATGGRAVLFISHKLREVLAVADRIAVLRRGRVVQVTPRAETDAGRLTEAVMGAGGGSPEPARPPARSSDLLLVARDLTCPPARGSAGLRGLSFQVARGETVGVAGVDGNGQSELAEALTGLRACGGMLSLGGRADFAATPSQARRAGVAHLPEDRQRRGLCGPLSVEENLALGHHAKPPYAAGVRIDRAGRRESALRLIAAFDIRPADPAARAGDLSGGNQQKLVAARELAGGRPPLLVVAVHPTRGLDPGAAQRVQDALRDARGGGAAVLLISLDLDELRALSDRILVLFDGRLAGEARPDASDEHLGTMMLGRTAARA
jgi:general nucleoside transport system ATP-binding protein